MCAVRARALPSAIACSLIFRISSTLPTYRGVTLLDRPAALRPRAGKDKLVWRLPLDSSTGKCHRCSVCASPSAHRADTEYSSTKRDGHVPPVPVTARTDRVRVTPSPHPGMGCLSSIFSHIRLYSMVWPVRVLHDEPHPEWAWHPSKTRYDEGINQLSRRSIVRACKFHFTLVSLAESP